MEVPQEERPRERLLLSGPSVLSDSEIVAVLLGTGIRGVPALQLARRLLHDSGGLVVTNVDKGRLNTRLQVDHSPLVDIADQIVLAGAFDIQFFQ